MTILEYLQEHEFLTLDAGKQKIRFKAMADEPFYIDLDRFQMDRLITELNLLRHQMEYPKDDPNDIDDEQYSEGPDYPY